MFFELGGGAHRQKDGLHIKHSPSSWMSPQWGVNTHRSHLTGCISTGRRGQVGFPGYSENPPEQMLVEAP